MYTPFLRGSINKFAERSIHPRIKTIKIMTTKIAAMTTQEIADKVVANCLSGHFAANYNELYDENVVSREPLNNSLGVESETKGLRNVVSRAEEFHNIIEKVLSKEISDPLVAGDHFTFRLCQEFELKGVGYVKLDELCLFRVKDGKIIYEEYFY